MSSDALPVEFVGGPMDGQSLWIESGTETIKTGSLDMDSGKVVVINHLYKLRRVNEIMVRLPNGLHAMDYSGKVA
jgi:hypothetical protein